MKIKTFFCLFFILILAYVVNAQDMSNSYIEVRNFKFGIMSKNSKDEFFVSREINIIPKQEGLKYGFTYDFTKLIDSGVFERVTIQSASSATVLGSLENKSVLSTNGLRELVMSYKRINQDSGNWNCVFTINKGDYPADYVMTIEHNNKITKRFKFTIKQIGKEED